MSVIPEHRITGCAIDQENREKDDFYPTPEYGTQALLNIEKFEGTIWEPACGEGHISKVLIKNGYEVISTDLVDRGYGEARVDFLMEYRPRSHNIITNPPFKNATDFMRKGLELTTGKFAMLLRLQALEGIERTEIYQSSPLARVYVFSKRLSIWRNGVDNGSTGMIAMAWFVWDHAYKGKPTIGWI